MKIVFCSILASLFLIGCGRNEPGTMGGEPGVPETVATGAPAETAKETSHTDRQQPALAQEHAASTLDERASTNTQPPAPDPTKRRNE